MKSIMVAAVCLASVASASAADLTARPYAKAPAMTAVAYNWTGWYVGVNGGGAWGHGTGNFVSTNDLGFFGPALRSGYLPQSLNARHSGGFGGAQMGYNWQMNNWLIGLEADIQGSDIGSSSTINFAGIPGVAVPGITEGRDHINWFGTVRGRMGFVVDQVLFYGTGGLAYGGVNSSVSNLNLVAAAPFNLISGSVSDTRVGWAAGAGIEWAFAPNWTVKAEYLHIDLGSTDVAMSTAPAPASTATYRFDHQVETARLGVNYRFGGPVVARY
jgi:outer membrane immunogenic protein